MYLIIAQVPLDLSSSRGTSTHSMTPQYRIHDQFGRDHCRSTGKLIRNNVVTPGPFLHDRLLWRRLLLLLSSSCSGPHALFAKVTQHASRFMEPEASYVLIFPRPSSPLLLFFKVAILYRNLAQIPSYTEDASWYNEDEMKMVYSRRCCWWRFRSLHHIADVLPL